MGQKRGSCVLVVSTDVDILRALSHALTLGDYAVTTARDLSEVAATPSGLPAPVMLYDLKDLDRREWDRLVEFRTAHPDLSVILLASLESAELDRALAEGLIAGYQVKPIRLTVLEACLDGVEVAGRRATALHLVTTNRPGAVRHPVKEPHHQERRKLP